LLFKVARGLRINTLPDLKTHRNKLALRLIGHATSASKIDTYALSRARSPQIVHLDRHALTNLAMLKIAPKKARAWYRRSKIDA
jgi:hypothetical protein